MAALLPKADIVQHRGNARFVPIADSEPLNVRRPPQGGLACDQLSQPVLRSKGGTRNQRGRKSRSIPERNADPVPGMPPA